MRLARLRPASCFSGDRITDQDRQRLIDLVRSDYIDARDPNEVIGPPDDPYLLRWYVVRGGVDWLTLTPQQRAAYQHDPSQENIYVHRFLRSDGDTALHDHPWAWRTIVLDGQYLEHVPAFPDRPTGPIQTHLVCAGDACGWRTPTDLHRIELPTDQPVLTLFYTGPKVRDWGFLAYNAWTHQPGVTSTVTTGFTDSTTT